MATHPHCSEQEVSMLSCREIRSRPLWKEGLPVILARLALTITTTKVFGHTHQGFGRHTMRGSDWRAKRDAAYNGELAMVRVKLLQIGRNYGPPCATGVSPVLKRVRARRSHWQNASGTQECYATRRAITSRWRRGRPAAWRARPRPRPLAGLCSRPAPCRRPARASVA